jgi:hypothetical protein
MIIGETSIYPPGSGEVVKVQFGIRKPGGVIVSEKSTTTGAVAATFVALSAGETLTITGDAESDTVTALTSEGVAFPAPS